jgi:glycosyltransferase involved in cell wall biosynthesis
MGEPALLYVGRLEKIKGLDLLLKAMVFVKKELPNVFLHIIGEGSQKKIFKNLSESLNLKEIKFYGKILRSRVQPYMLAADIVVVPSRYEAFGIVALEAMSCGKPVILSGKGGFKDFVNNYKNSVVARMQSKDIAEKIILLWKNDELREKIKEGALKTALDFPWKRVAQKYLKTYHKILQKYNSQLEIIS